MASFAAATSMVCAPEGIFANAEASLPTLCQALKRMLCKVTVLTGTLRH
jgi:hypothetical protein